MNQKIIMAMAVLLILIGGIGIFIFSGGKNDEQVSNVSSQVEKKPAIEQVSVNFAVAKIGLKAGSIITEQDIKIETVLLEPGHWLVEEQEAGQLFMVGYVTLDNINANSRIRSSQVAMPGSPAYLSQMVTPGYRVYSFNLSEQQISQLATTKAGEYVDVYFRYNMIISGYKTQILQRVEPEIRRIGNFNGTKVLPILSAKKLLYMDQTGSNGVVSDINKMIKKDTKTENSNVAKPRPESSAKLYVELSDHDIKRLYTLDPYGDFIIFPASFAKNKASSTDETLPENIRQLKGKKG
ncbi:hypothetical protein ACSMDF_16940 [Yersinia enterocolitica]|uniref:Flp pilus assembly protein CpaB n=1 Tax=Yersinia massiliensis TaxID=419257 RepID=A0ABM6UPK8_9GAMM|nr:MULTISPECIES: hypothetical protein [Yersinia]HEI6967133.1 hypothetical protein [Yersinia enterocolitica]ATM87372.1 hypothetical protein CRN74_15575 [Yersinia frederiksenii]AVX36825.1 hypothetical protein DA391_03620 [Yersinia massiliensis]MCB5317816.1 hypothetical protein [Yersinia massiliensis]QKJ11629.1 hypothetical protein HRD68_13395 [Yersinia massiliensis]